MAKSVLYLLLSFSFFSQVEKTVQVTGEYIGAVSPSMGYKKAKEAAINTAIEKVAGINVSTTTSMFKKEVSDELIESYSNYFTSFSNATVKQIKQLKRKMEPLEEDVLKFLYLAEITLVVDEDGSDPGFTITANLNKPAFVEGDPLQVSVKSSKDSYITVLNITQDNDVLILLPNPYMKNNFVESRDVRMVPEQKDLERGIVFETENKTNKKFVTEIIIVIATKENIPILGDKHGSGFLSLSKNQFHQWVSKIPLNMRSMDTKIYEIFNK